MASPPAAWDCRVVPSWPSNAEPVKALSEAHVGHPSVELADYRTEYRLLGPLEVVHRGEAVPTGGQRKRALLARLLLEANRTVSIDALVDALWGERVPSTAVKMVHIYVSQLRKVLPSGALQTRPPGYRLEVAPEAVDLLRFERLRKEGREALADGDAATAAERLTAACALWRGPALGEFSEPFAAAAAAHLDELRLARRRGPGRRGARARPPSRRRRGAAGPRGEPSAPRASSPPADAGAVPAGKARRGARGLPGAASRAPRRAGDRPVGRPGRAAVPHPQPGSGPRPCLAGPGAGPTPSRPRCPRRPPATGSSAGRRSWRGSSRRSTKRRPGTARPP